MFGAAGSASGVNNAMTARTPYVNGSVVEGEAKVVQVANYNGSPCQNALYLYSRAILEAKGPGGSAYGTVSSSPWTCRTLNSTTTASGCPNSGLTSFQVKGNWRNENGSNTTVVSARASYTCA